MTCGALRIRTATRAVLLAPSSLPVDPLILKVQHTMESKSFAEFSKDETKEKVVMAGIWDRTDSSRVYSEPMMLDF